MEVLVIIGVCLVINALFSCFEMAFVSASKAELRKFAKNGVGAAQKILNLRENPERTLSTIQIGITLVGMISAAVGGAGAEESIAPLIQEKFYLSEKVAEAIAIIGVVLPLTLINVVLGELVPKTLALREPVRISILGARWIEVFEKIVAPVVSLLEWATKVVLLPFPKKKISLETETTSVDIEHLSQQTRQYVLNLVKIETLRAKDAMLKWDLVVTVSQDQSLAEVTSKAVSSGHTRLPVVHNGRPVGVLHTKEFIALLATGEQTDWQTLIRPLIEVSENDLALKALRLMQSKRSHLSVVLDSASNPIGVLAMEDVLEEIVGEIYDEDDDGRIRKLLSGTKNRAFLKK